MIIMARRFNWDAHRYRKRNGPLISKEEDRDNKLKAQKLKERVAKGHKSPQAHLHGPVRHLSPEEIAAWAAENGYTVKSPKGPANDNPSG
ncbi:hypothetical protein [Novosphingobium pituita]|nr:hypothetical protein [Novosphingobium sp. IK01]